MGGHPTPPRECVPWLFLALAAQHWEQAGWERTPPGKLLRLPGVTEHRVLQAGRWMEWRLPSELNGATSRYSHFQGNLDTERKGWRGAPKAQGPESTSGADGGEGRSRRRGEVCAQRLTSACACVRVRDEEWGLNCTSLL